MSTMTIAESIRNHREKNGMTQMDLAKRIGIPQSYVSLWEADKCRPSIFFAVCLADAFDITLDELVGRTVKTNEGK